MWLQGRGSCGGSATRGDAGGSFPITCEMSTKRFPSRSFPITCEMSSNRDVMWVCAGDPVEGVAPGATLLYSIILHDWNTVTVRNLVKRL